MALEVFGGRKARGARVRDAEWVEESPRWRRYYEVIGFGWERALVSLKGLLEK